MALTLGTSLDALRATRMLDQAHQRLSINYNRLSSGSRINRASDDAAGLAVSSQLRASARILSQAMLNANDGISGLSITEGGLTGLRDILFRLKELSTQAANGNAKNLTRY